MLKQRLQGMIFGVLSTILVFFSVTMLVASARTIEISHGVNVVVNGVQQQFAEDLQPFTAEGRTFLPVRGIADALGLEVQWVGATSTVYLTSPDTAPPAPAPTPAPPVAPTGRPLLGVAPWFEQRGLDIVSVTMRGETFSNAIRLRVTGGGTWSHHDLNGNFTTLTGIYGRVDGSGEVPSTIRFLGDGVELASFFVSGDTRPTEFSVNVTGVTTLRIEITGQLGSSAIAALGNVELK